MRETNQSPATPPKLTTTTTTLRPATDEDNLIDESTIAGTSSFPDHGTTVN